VTEASTPGRSLVSRRAIADIVRTATIGSYGVTGLVDQDPLDRLLAVFGLARPGIELDLDGALKIEIHLTVASGLPVAEVARQVDSAVRYALRRAVGRDVDELTIHVDGLRYRPGAVPTGLAPGPATSDVSSSDLAGSGMDLA
jgi:uncharacterized alkaline shock family protein YloU